MSRSLIARVIVIIVVVGAVLATGVAIGSSRKSATTSYTWISQVRGESASPNLGSNQKPLPFGSVVTIPRNDVDSVSAGLTASITGRDGFGLVFVHSLLYPVRTINAGSSWTIDGTYWFGPWADADAGATYIDAISPTVAVAYGVQWLYVTEDGGKHWYIVKDLQNVEGVEPSSVVTLVGRHLPLHQVVVDVSAIGPTGARSTAQYISSHDGRVWTLL